MRIQILKLRAAAFGALIGWAACSASGGSIGGVVRAQGKEAPDSGANGGGRYQSKELKFVQKVDYGAIHDFVVYIEGSIPGTKPPAEPVKVIQKNATFDPHLLPIMIGTRVAWPNQDEVFHNVFSKSQPKQFNLGLYKRNDTPGEVIFDKPGEVDVFCSIHANMSCVVLVLENPCFAATDSKGHYSITNVPPGAYKLTAWQERLFSRTQEITVPETGEVKADFVLGPDAK